MRLDREKFTSHIKDNEKVMEMRKLLDKIDIVLNNHTIESTDFLDPYERYLAKSILNRIDGIKYLEHGVRDGERQIIVIFPDYYYEDNIETNIDTLEIRGDLEKINHKDYLGALLNLGIKRSKIGDILVNEEGAYVVVKNEVSNFVIFNLEKVSNKNVVVKEVNVEEIVFPEPLFKEIKVFLSSLRLDVIISAAYNLSRQESMNIIKSGNVKVNWEPIDKPSKELEEGDVISTRGYGRCILHSIEGISKKGRLRSTIRILI